MFPDALFPVARVFGFLLIFLWGFLLLLSPVGLFRLAPIIIAGLVMRKVRKTAPEKMTAIGVAVFLAYVADVLAWWFSKEAIAPEQATRLWGSWPSAFLAGFPFHALELPPPPLGPGDEWANVVTITPNLLFWLAVFCILVLPLSAALRKTGLAARMKTGRSWLWLTVGSLLANGLFMATYMLWFD